MTSESKFVNNRYRNYYHIEESGKEYLKFIISNYEEITNASKAFMEDSFAKQNKEKKSE